MPATVDFPAPIPPGQAIYAHIDPILIRFRNHSVSSHLTRSKSITGFAAAQTPNPVIPVAGHISSGPHPLQEGPVQVPIPARRDYEPTVTGVNGPASKYTGRRLSGQPSSILCPKDVNITQEIMACDEYLDGNWPHLRVLRALSGDILQAVLTATAGGSQLD